MVAFLTNLKLVLLTLVLLNGLLIFLFKNELRLVIGPMILFILLLCSFLGYRFVVYPGVKNQIETDKAAEIKNRGWEYLKEPDIDTAFIKREQKNSLTMAALFRITGLQTVFAFVLAITGVFATRSKKLYGIYALSFLLLAFLFLK